MLYILYGTIKNKLDIRGYIHNIDGYFDGYFDPSWIDINGWANEVLQEIDKSKFIAPKIVESPVLGCISHEWISGGSKQLIMMNVIQDALYDGDNFGDNCWNLLLKLSKEKDIMMTLTYYPSFEWVEGAKITIMNSCSIVSNYEEFNSGHLNTVDRDKEFDISTLTLPLPFNQKQFELEEIDF